MKYSEQDIVQRYDAPEDEVKSIERSVRHDYELSEPNSQRALDEAEKDNLEVVFPTPFQLQIDIDSNRAYEVYLAMRPLLEKYYGIYHEKTMYSRSGAPKRHITVDLYRTIGEQERILLQVLMGSDRVREFLGLIQFNNGDPHPVLFLEKKPEVNNAGPTVSEGSGDGNTL
jgi:hypothetical protein